MAIRLQYIQEACGQPGWLGRCQVWAYGVNWKKEQLDTDRSREGLDYETETLWNIGILV